MRLDVVLHSLRSAWAGWPAASHSTAARAAPRRSRKTISRRRRGMGCASDLGIDQDDAKVVDVGVRRPAYDEAAGRLEEAGGVIVVQEHLGIQVSGTRQRRRLDHGAGRITGFALTAVDAVGVG